MKYYLLAFLFVCALSVEEYAKEENVVILTDDNFDEYIKTHEHVLVKFYAPWCGHCKKLAPEYSKAAAKLEKENLFLAQVDATVHKKLAEKYQIQGYPTVKLFIKGADIEYNGGRTEKDIVNWMRKKTTGQAVKPLKDQKELDDFKKANEVCIVYFGDNADDLKEIEMVAREYEDYVFGKVSDKAVMEQNKAKDRSIVLFKSFDELRNDMTDPINKKNIMDFANAHSSPLVMKFDDKAAQLIFGKNVPGLILYRDEKAENVKELEEVIRKVAEQVKGKLQVCVTDIKEGLQSRLAEYIGVKKEDLPTVRIADTKQDLKKYNFEGKIEVDAIMEFLKKWEHGSLKPFLKTQEIPKEQKGPVFTLVGKAFADEVIRSDRDVLVKFYAPWCGHCKKLAPIYEELAKKYKDNKKLLIAECDATENEVDEVSITGFPTIKFWPAKNKEKAIDFNGDRTIEGFEKFLKEHASYPLGEPAKTEEKKDEKDAKEGKKTDL